MMTIADLGPQELADVITALSKWPSDPSCTETASEAAQHLLRSPGTSAGLGPQELADVITALSKWPSDRSCAETASAFAQRLLDSEAKVKLSKREAYTVVTALRTWPSNETCAKAASKLERFEMDRFNSMVVHLALLPHSRSDTPKSPAE